MARACLPKGLAMSLDNLTAKIYNTTQIQWEGCWPRRLAGYLPSLAWSFFRSCICLRGRTARHCRRPQPRKYVEVLCQVIPIAVYTARPRNGGLPGWMTTWPSVPSAAMPWPGKLTTFLRHILRAKAAGRKSHLGRKPMPRGGGAVPNRGSAAQGTGPACRQHVHGPQPVLALPLAFSRFWHILSLFREMNSPFATFLPCHNASHEGSGQH